MCELFICTHCEMLLMKVDKKYITYTSGEFGGNSYIDNDSFGDDAFDGYVCPRCSGIELGLNASDSEVATLKVISIPVATASEIARLWNENRSVNDDVRYYGIPLSDTSLKELLAEHLI